MATVIDALVVTLGLDPAKYIQGQKEATVSLKKTSDEATRTAKELEARGVQAASFFAKIRNEVIALTAAFVGMSALKAFSERITASDAALGRMATNVGMTTEDLGAWEGAAERAGGTAGGLAGTVSGLSKQLQMFSVTGQSDLVPMLSAAHVNLQKFFDASTPMVERLRMLADAAAALHNPAKAQAMLGSLGIDEGTINLLMQGRAAVDAMIAKQKEMNAVTREDTNAAIARHNAWLDLSDTIQDVGRAILTDLTPDIVAALKGMQAWVKENREWIKIELGNKIRELGPIIRDVIAFVKEWSTAIEVLFAFWAASRVAGVILGIGQMGAAMAAAIGGMGAAWLALPAALVAYLGFRIGGTNNDQAGLDFEKEARDRFAKEHPDKVLPQRKPGEGLEPLPSLGNQDQAPATLPGGASEFWTALADKALGALISRGEGAYNSVNRGAAGGYKAGTEDLENMTVAQVMTAQAMHKFNAAGRYQIIGDTMKAAAAALGLTGSEKFDKAMQDRIFGEYLLKNKRRAIGDYITGKSDDLSGAISAAAKEWASVADPATGQSHYAGVGNNRASISVAEMANALRAARFDAARSSYDRAANSTTVHIGHVTVNDAKDAAGTAKALHKEVRKQFASAAQAQYGLA